MCGMKNEKVQRRLLTMKNLTYATALEEAEMAERVARDAAQFHESGPIVEVHQVLKKTERCYRCEGQHNPQTCWALKEECRYCHKPGHIERTCRKKLRDNRFKKSSHKVKKVEEATLQDSTTFSKIDLQSAYLQMRRIEGSHNYLHTYRPLSFQSLSFWYCLSSSHLATCHGPSAYGNSENSMSTR